MEGANKAAREALMEPRLERFIGVIYRRDTERWSQYSSAILPRQLDGWVWFDETTAVAPLPTRQRDGAEDTSPLGLSSTRPEQKDAPSRWYSWSAGAAEHRICRYGAGVGGSQRTVDD